MMYVVSPRSRQVHTVERERHEGELYWLSTCGSAWALGNILVEPEMPATGHLCTSCFPPVNNVVRNVDNVLQNG